MNELRYVFLTESSRKEVPCGLFGEGNLANHKEGVCILHEAENCTELVTGGAL